MPIYEYECRACGNQFELLILPAMETPLACPACASQELERLLSAFAVSSEGISKSNIAAARRKLATSNDYRDKRISDHEEEMHHMHEDYGIDPKRKVTPLGQKPK